MTCELPGSSSSSCDITNITTQAVGTSVTTDPIQLPTCDDLYTFTVVAVDASSVRGKASNPVRESVSCSYQPDDKLTSGQIAGIVIGSILGLIIILIIVYLCCNRENLDDLWLWRMLTCRCCFKDEKDDDRLYNPPPRSPNKQSDVIRNNTNTTTNTTVTPIRNISDLYSRPNVEAKKRTQQLKNEQQQQQVNDSDDDGGFRDQQERRRNNVGAAVMTSVSGQSVTYIRNQHDLHQHTKNNGDDQSSKSSVTSQSTTATIPINQVGLPPASSYQRDNYGYDGPYQDSYGGYVKSDKPYYRSHNTQQQPPIIQPKPTAPPPPRPARNNTQV